MTVRLNEKALSHARGLLRQGDVTYDERDDWSEHAPSADEENRFIDEHGMAALAELHLGEDTPRRPVSPCVDREGVEGAAHIDRQEARRP